MKRQMFCVASAVALALVSQAIGQDVRNQTPAGQDSGNKTPIVQDGGNQTPLASNFLYNYYTQPGASQVTAGMYPAPYWGPPNVGHTYYTYQPLMPHEHMYEHRRNYYQYYGGPGAFYQDPCNQNCASGGYGLNKTTVVWQGGASHVGPSPFSWDCFQRLGYHCASRHYCLGGNCGGAGCAGGNCAGGCGPGGCQ